MRLMSSLSALASLPPPVWFTLGTFDGVHRGHRAVLRTLLDTARVRGGSAAAITFDPHPQEVVRPDSAPPLLFTGDEMIDAVGETGIDALVVLRFDRDLAMRSGEAFLRDVLASAPEVKGVVLGHDSRLGRGRRTGVEEVRAMARAEGFEILVVPPVMVAGEPVSSTRIRRLLVAGDMSGAADLLGRPYSFRGPVVTGDARGRELGFPTANIAAPAGRKLLPPDGIYATRVTLPPETPPAEREFPGAMSIGMRPTFGAGPRVIEIHLIGFSGELVGRTLDVQVLERLREEKRFDSVDALIEAMGEDCRRTVEIAAAAERARGGAGAPVGHSPAASGSAGRASSPGISR